MIIPNVGDQQLQNLQRARRAEKEEANSETTRWSLCSCGVASTRMAPVAPSEVEVGLGTRTKGKHTNKKLTAMDAQMYILGMTTANTGPHTEEDSGGW